ncbi:DMT family transporter [Microvirga puerhi]|uniref:DMT family transporter n=1 Tax=Microvirga puerhi TaxID=2876078 RepID=A0ABS7VL39_9HYPH|nr:DMT family transporter [Microvirga puerhi]MBZ6075850.1 DMT family transporter [Microvirga puerhi]
MSPSSPASGLLFALGSAGLYGLNIVYARVAALGGVSGPAVVIYRVLLMLALFGAVAAIMRRSLVVAREERGTMAVLGVSTAFVGLCYVSSVAFIPVTVAAVLFYAYPTFIVLASPLVEGTKLTPALVGVVFLALLGIVLVVGPAFGDLDWRGLALALGAAAATATQFFAAARCRKTDITAKMFWIHLIVLPTAVLAGAATGQLTSPTVLALAPFGVIMTVGGYVIGFLFQIVALGRISAVAAGIVYCIEPVVSAITSTIVLGERIGPVQALGGCLVLAAIVTNILLERSRAAPIVPTD